jgi:hypothetical protein
MAEHIHFRRKLTLEKYNYTLDYHLDRTIADRKKTHIPQEEVDDAMRHFLNKGGKIKRDPVIQRVMEGKIVRDIDIPKPVIREKFGIAFNDHRKSKKLLGSDQGLDTLLYTEREAAELLGVEGKALKAKRLKRGDAYKSGVIKNRGVVYYTRRYLRLRGVKFKEEDNKERRLLTEDEAAKFLGLKRSTLANRRNGFNKKKGVPFLRFPFRIFYDFENLKKYKEEMGT